MPRHPAFLVGIAALTLAACGNDRAPGDDDDVGPDAGPTSSLRYYEDVAPILAKHCGACHREGGVGPFPLITFDDAMNVAAIVPHVVETRQMPPYGADNSGDCNTYREARWLSDGEIATLVEWFGADRKQGDPAAAPPPPQPLPPLARVDATAGMTEPYTSLGGLADDYRCFIVDAKIAQDSFLTGFEVRPGKPEVVHHILVYQLDNANAETEAANLDAATAGPGYTCFGGPGAAASLVGVWAPGMRVASYPAGTGLALKGDRKFVLQIHYHEHANGPQADQTAVDLMIESSVPNPSSLFLMAAPQLYLPPQQPNVSFSNALTIPGFLGQYNVWGAFPHMHTLGRTLRVDLEHAGTNRCLVDVPRWDFNWQQGYFYDNPPLTAGGSDTLRITCTYDTTSRGEPVMWGEGTNDEMCLSFFYISPY
jgi:hypothetical protein